MVTAKGASAPRATAANAIAIAQRLVGDPWPDPQFLRQGNQAIGWVFLNRVPLGYEIWRRLNGFPPVLAPPSKEPEGKESKPPKVKVG
jgi:hypothetical protein